MRGDFTLRILSGEGFYPSEASATAQTLDKGAGKDLGGLIIFLEDLKAGRGR